MSGDAGNRDNEAGNDKTRETRTVGVATVMANYSGGKERERKES